MSERDEAIAPETIVLNSSSLRNSLPLAALHSDHLSPRSLFAWLRAGETMTRLVDLGAVLAGALLVAARTGAGHRRVDAEILLLLLAVVATPFCFDRLGLYASGRRRPVATLGRIILAIVGVVGLFLLADVALFPSTPPSFEFFAMWAGVTLALVLFGRAGLAVAEASPRWLPRDRVAVVGSSDLAFRVAAHLEARTVPANLVGLFDDMTSPARVQPDMAQPAHMDDLKLRLSRGEVDRVVLALSENEHARIEKLRRDLAPYAIDVSVCAGRRLPWDTATDAKANAWLAGDVVARPLLRRPLSRRELFVKAVEDRVLGLLLLVGLSLLFLVIGLAIKMTSPGPVFFKQKRHGFRNREITVYKFRSMRTDVADFGGRVQTKRNDPRVTRIGRFLRKSSLDELPQLINVVRGEMSLVGPRPLPIDMRTDGLLCSEIVEDYFDRHRVKPGITGWAQINGYRGATTTAEQVQGRVRLDNDYIENWSLFLDFRIMALTVVRAFNDENAF